MIGDESALKSNRLAIIGGGASGFAAAIEAKYASPALGITIFDRMPKACKKILATGNGRCNFSNVDLSPAHFHGEANFLRSVLTSAYADDESFFRELGVLTYCEDGRLYPRSQQASTIRDTLIDIALSKDVKILTDTTVCDIKKSDAGYIVNNECFDAVILCGGGKSAPQQGSDGSCYKLAKSLGHTITPLHPALCGLATHDKSMNNLKGVRCKGTVSLFINNKLIDTDAGEIQFTDKGVSGIPVMNLSHHCKDAQDIRLVVDLCNDISAEEMLTHLNATKQSYPDKETEIALNGIVNNKIGFVVMDRAGIKPHTLLKDINNNKIKLIVDELKNFEIICNGTKGFDNSQITCGGVSTNEVDSKTMMSKINNGLFLCGEILDIHGDCGGYNLHLAWTTGRIAGSSAAEYLER